MFSNRRAPGADVILRLVNRIRTTGLVQLLKKVVASVEGQAWIVENEDVLHAFVADSTRTIRIIARMVNVAGSSIQKIL